MAKYGRGLICLSLTEERLAELRLPMMVSDNTSRFQTAFTVSVDARKGVATGISAADRAKTILTAIDESSTTEDLVSPGHIFPLMAQPGGVLTRAGHTEAGCDLTRLAGLEPAAVIVEILNEDGTMARRPDLEIFAQQHGLKMGTIADLIQYRLAERTDRGARRRVQDAYRVWRVPSDLPSLRLLMLGAGSLEPALGRRLHTAGLLDRVHFPGKIRLEDLPTYYRAADVYLTASLSDGSSVSLLEAMACGLPAVVSDIPGNREWVSQENGWRFPAEDAAALDTVLTTAHTARDRLPALGKRSRAIAVERAGWDANFPRLLEAYRLALAAGGTA